MTVAPTPIVEQVYTDEPCFTICTAPSMDSVNHQLDSRQSLAMDHLLNDEDAADDTNEPSQPLPAQLAASARSPSSSAAGLGLQMLSAAPPRLPPISLLTAAAAALQPAAPQLRPMRTANLHAGGSPTSSCASRTPPPPRAAPPDDLLCRYRNKKCGHPRAIKRNGERHNLCEHHRNKANQNQRKLESKRRTKKRLLQRVHLAADRVGKAKKVAADAEVTVTLYGAVA